MPRTLYFCGVEGFSSMLILAMVSLSLRSPAMSSSAGAIARQGPHHSAQKSTRTGLPAFKTSESNDASVTLVVFILSPDIVVPDRPRASGAPKYLGGAPKGVKIMTLLAGSCFLKSFLFSG